jgi:CrcB protein
MNTAYFWVVLGGALGAVARFGLTAAITAVTGPAFPWATLLINVTGSFAIGLFASFTTGARHLPYDIAAFLMVGICGGFTTFSSFSLQTFELAQSGERLRAGIYILLSVILCLVFVRIGVLF